MQYLLFSHGKNGYANALRIYVIRTLPVLFYSTARNDIRVPVNGNVSVDGAAITVVQHKTSKVIGVKGKRQTASPISAEMVAQAKFVTCMRTPGLFAPTLMALPGKNMKCLLLSMAVTGTIAVHTSGSLKAPAFSEWLGIPFLFSNLPPITHSSRYQTVTIPKPMLLRWPAAKRCDCLLIARMNTQNAAT
jgi:hypothetical protein